MKIKITTKVPGQKSLSVQRKMKRLNGGWGQPIPLLMTGEGQGCYFKDADGNTFLDFASNVYSPSME